MADSISLGPQSEYDVFISHASEDKDGFVRPLAGLLRELGVKVWYDEFSLSIGDRLARSINRGLAGSRFGLVVISKNFVAKDWPATEMDVLLNRQVSSEKLILPIWLGVTKSEVKTYNETLSDLVAIRADGSNAIDIAFELIKVIRPDIYEKINKSMFSQSRFSIELNDELAERLKESIRKRIKTNTTGAITGQVLQDTLVELVDFVKSSVRYRE